MEDYLLSVYDFITKQDNTFSGDVDIDTFKSKMQDDSYAKEIYGYMSSVDKSFASDLDESAFIQAVKKKDSSELQNAMSSKVTEDTPSPLVDGQSSLVESTQASVEERLTNLSDEEKSTQVKAEELRPFYESQGLNYDEVANIEAIKQQS